MVINMLIIKYNLKDYRLHLKRPYSLSAFSKQDDLPISEVKGMYNAKFPQTRQLSFSNI